MTGRELKKIVEKYMGAVVTANLPFTSVIKMLAVDAWLGHIDVSDEDAAILKHQIRHLDEKGTFDVE